MCLWTVYQLDFMSMNYLSIKCCVYELSIYWMLCPRTNLSIKCCVYELFSLWITVSMKCLLMKYVVSIICHFYVLSLYWYFCLWVVLSVKCMNACWRYDKILNWNNNMFISQKRISLLFDFTKIQTYHLRIHSVNIKYAEQNLN